MALSITIDLQTNSFIEPEARRDFRSKLLNVTAVRFSRNDIKGDFRYMALYTEFLASEQGGYGKRIFKFRMEPYAVNIPFKDFMFGVN